MKKQRTPTRPFTALLTICLAWMAFPGTLWSQSATQEPRIVGAMKNVMWKGELQGLINLDTIADKQYLYGLGPVENLAGEILILGGRAYKSSVVNGSTLKVEENYRVKAPFFSYANIEKWVDQPVPDSVQDLRQLETYLLHLARNSTRPFLFRLEGVAESASVHVVNLPPGAKVASPEDAHNGQVNDTIRQSYVEILGFFSRSHQSVFTHHDTYLHLHLITEDRKKMGHLDAIRFRKRTVRLFLPID